MINTVGAGKGSTPRKVDLTTYYENFDAIFRKGKEGHSAEGTEERVLSQTQEGELAQHARTDERDQ
jgi:hypothetical protein